ncbi:DUF5059 domain-containing protein [Haloarcula halophila]|uniref:DUF5059 domain-containing protein n=1 Tax=Haloarcula TaxID=2237 RepID=UPI0023E35720|nr:DUF5059 domain-containing protein [Halomicroarcula sp. DFY41]
MPDRRDLLKTVGIAASGLLAGCPGSSSNAQTDDGSTATQTETATRTEEPTATAEPTPVGPMTAVAAEWSVYRARLYDAVALGRAGAPAAGATVAGNIFARFEGANGEYGAHERLESTSEAAYEGFEGALGDLQSALSEGNVEAAADAADTASSALQTAQQAATTQRATRVFDLLVIGSRANNAGGLARAGAVEAAGPVAEAATISFEDGLVHDVLESADEGVYERFESALSTVQSAAGSGDGEGVVEAAGTALDAAVEGAYAIASAQAVADTGHLATLQSRGWDAAAVSLLGGPGADYAHAATLNSYRARVADAQWLARRGGTDTAGQMAQDVFAHFEGAAAHDPFEEANSEAYEAFESGLSSLTTAIDDGDTSGIGDAVGTVDTNLVAGIEALAGGSAPVLQSGFFKARFADARELYRQDKNAQAVTVTQDLFERFEANELDFHETLEETSESLYETFEEEHLTSLITAYENGDDAAVDTHHQGVLDALLSFESEYTPAVASGSGATYMAALGFDAAAVDALGHDARAAELGQQALAFFENGAAGYHEALEEADEELYHRFEDEALGAVISAAQNGEDVYPPAKSFGDAAVETVSAITAASGGSDAPVPIAQGIFQTFENASVHDRLESASQSAYEGFESALSDYVQGLQSGSGDPASFAAAARTAQFAVVGAVDAAPSGGTGGSGGESESDPSLSGGPNVVEGVPEDADHVVGMQAVAFDPEELTVNVGDTVAFEHAAGEAHNVVAYDDGIPEGADYWASGGFDSESAAREGWESGEGAVQSGQSYVHTFETAGEHEYFCTPHEAAGMVGTIVVEE